MHRPPKDLRLDPPIPALFPERDALLAAIRDADPADDLPALVYADWQDEHDQPEHAELIRVMVELARARKKDAPSKAHRPKLLARMVELFKTPALKPLRKLETDTWKFTRGFVRDLTFHLTDRRTPSVRAKIEVLPTELADLPERVPFDKLASLGMMLPEGPTNEHVVAFAAVPWLKRVNRIETHRWDLRSIRPGTFAPLVTSKHLGGLLCFEPHGPIAGSELVAIYLAKSATGMREFSLHGAQWGAMPDSVRKPNRKAYLNIVEQIVSSKRAKQFTSFGEDLTDVDEALAKILLASPHLKNVRRFRYVFRKTTQKTQTAFAARFGKPERIG